MKSSILCLLSLATVLTTVIGQNPNPTTTFSNNQILQSPDLYYLYWNYNTQNITFEIHVKNAAWALFGIKGSTYSDVIVASMFADGTGHYSERTLYSNNTITTNPVLNWFLLDAFTSNNYTVFKFYRNLKLQCNQASTPSLDITTGTNTLIFATGSTFNQNDSSIVVSNPTTVQVNLLPTIATTTQLSCVSPPATAVFNSTPTGYYANSIDLIPGIYRLLWNVSGSDIIAEIHCQTTGWVAFGLSPDGQMDYSNVVIGYIATDGSVNFTDRFISPESIDITKNQSAKLLASGRVNGYTYFKFTRPLKVCDSQHLSFTQGTPHVIYAFGTTQLTPGSDIAYHNKNRGSQQLNILNVPSSIYPDPSDTEHIDFTIKNAVLPKIYTYYYVQLFQVPPSLSKRHIFKIGFQLPQINTMNIHHMLVYECASNYSGTPAPTSHDSFVDLVKGTYCTSTSFGWAVGGDLMINFPVNTGYPVGGDTDYKYFILEVHYNNPPLDIGYIDSLTMRYYMTKQLRPNELGVLTIGTASSPLGLAIPPNQSSFVFKTYCSNSCLKSQLANQNITVISSILHTHLTGTSVDTRIIRNGVDTGFIFANHQYDFNYQQMYMLNPPIVLTKNDALLSQCTYNTQSRTGFTLGGTGTLNEMCLVFLTYYPRNAFRQCYSIPYLNEYVDLLNNFTASGDLKNVPKLNYTMESLSYGMNLAYAQFDKQSPISTNVINKYLDFFNNSLQSELCQDDFNYGPLNRIMPSNVYVEPDVCALPTSTFNNSTNMSGQLSNTLQAVTNFFNTVINWFLNIFNN